MLFVGVLSVMTALGAWGPAFARMLGGPAVHACHCETRDGHHDACACPICYPEIGAVDVTGHDAVTGTCGDEDRVRPTPSMPAVLVASSEVVPATVLGFVGPRRRALDPPSWRAPPPDEPPRTLS